MVEAQRALLDELMGVARNLTDEEKKQYREIQWDDKEVCGCYLIRFCPHDLFVNTKSDLGPCPKVHDPKLKESYESSSRYQLYIPRFEAELAQFCEKLVQDLDRKVRRGRERLAQDVDIASLVPMPAEKAEQLGTIEEKIKKLLEQIETLGEEGKVDEAQALMKKVDLLNLEKTSLLSQASSERGLVLSQEKKMALCEICGSFLVANETMERTQSHISGKQHVGFGMVRDYLVEYKEKKDKMREEEKQKAPEEGEPKEENDSEKREENGREQNRERNDRDRDPRERNDRDPRSDRYGERHRYRDRGRGRYGRGRDLDRNRDRNWDRERNKERNYRRGRSRSPPNLSPGRHSSKRR